MGNMRRTPRGLQPRCSTFNTLGWKSGVECTARGASGAAAPAASHGHSVTRAPNGQALCLSHWTKRSSTPVYSARPCTP
eukprot:1925090-Prymnesium_polylepis.1